MTIAAVRKKWKPSRVAWSRDRREFMDSALTQRQAEILRYILSCWLKGFLPTYEEIGEQFGMVSKNGARVNLKSLERKGCVEMIYQRGYRLTDKALDLAI